MHDRLIASGYRSPDFRLHVLGRQIGQGQPIPDVDPKRVLLSDAPAAVIKPLEF
jgi:hypothetical protein